MANKLTSAGLVVDGSPSSTSNAITKVARNFNLGEIFSGFSSGYDLETTITKSGFYLICANLSIGQLAKTHVSNYNDYTLVDGIKLPSEGTYMYILAEQPNGQDVILTYNPYKFPGGFYCTIDTGNFGTLAYYGDTYMGQIASATTIVESWSQAFDIYYLRLS